MSGLSGYEGWYRGPDYGVGVVAGGNDGARGVGVRVLLLERPDSDRGVLHGSADESDPGAGYRGVRKDWLLLNAWAAPRRPEVDDHGLAPQIAHTDLVPVALLDATAAGRATQQATTRPRRR